MKDLSTYTRVLVLCLVSLILPHLGQAQAFGIRGKLPGIDQVRITYQGSTFIEMMTDTVPVDNDGIFFHEILLKNGPNKCYLSFAGKELVLWASEAQSINIQLRHDGEPEFSGETKTIQD